MTAMLLSMMLAATVQASTPKPASTPPFAAELQPLLAALRRAGYVVSHEPPPVAGAYGLTDTRRRRIWIAPITAELGIARAALIHEAVHAAQGCGRGMQQPIGWPISLDPVLKRHISALLLQGYPHGSFEVEREAFGMQSHPQALNLISKALDQRCGQRR